MLLQSCTFAQSLPHLCIIYPSFGSFLEIYRGRLVLLCKVDCLLNCLHVHMQACDRVYHICHEPTASGRTLRWKHFAHTGYLVVAEASPLLWLLLRLYLSRLLSKAFPSVCSECELYPTSYTNYFEMIASPCMHVIWIEIGCCRLSPGLSKRKDRRVRVLAERKSMLHICESQLFWITDRSRLKDSPWSSCLASLSLWNTCCECWSSSKHSHSAQQMVSVMQCYSEIETSVDRSVKIRFLNRRTGWRQLASRWNFRPMPVYSVARW